MIGLPEIERHTVWFTDDPGRGKKFFLYIIHHTLVNFEFS